MKKIMFNYKYSFMLVMAVMLSSCDEGLLETAPYSFTSPENFYQTASDAELAINACYSILNEVSVNGGGNWDTFGRGLLFLLNAGTDEMVTTEGFGNIDYAPWGLASFTSSNKFLRFNWLFWYAGINRINLLLENIDQIEMDDESRRKEIKAEARFLRGLYHMYLAKMFGGVPTYTSSVADPEKGRQPLNEVYELIIDDLKYGYENLNHRATKTGRANKWTAGGYLAKVYAYLGSCKKFGVGEDLGFELNSFSWVDDADMYNKALDLTTTIVAQSGYVLIDEYDNLFRASTDSHQRQECLFMAEGSEDSFFGANLWINNMIPAGVGAIGGGYGWMRPTGELFHRYADGDFRRLHNLTGSLENGADTEIIDGVTYYIPNVLADPSDGDYTIAKLRQKPTSEKNFPEWATGGNFPLLRFADILLLHAEAQFFTGDEVNARNTLSLVRARAVVEGTTVDDLNTAYFKADFVDELLDERSRELAFECQRRFDLMRFNKFTEAINGLALNTGRWNVVVPQLQSNWAPNRIWFPLPLDQTEVNPNLLPNNPGF